MKGRPVDDHTRRRVLALLRQREHPGGPGRWPTPTIAGRVGLSIDTVTRIANTAIDNGRPMPRTRRALDGKLHSARYRPWPAPAPRTASASTTRAQRIAAGDALAATAAPLADLLGPDMAGARCRGLAPLHDDQLDDETPDERTARHQLAVQVCRQCPALARCALVEADLPRDVRGVWAGHIRTGRAA